MPRAKSRVTDQDSYTWSGVGKKIAASNQGDQNKPIDLDGIRRQYLLKLHQLTGRHTILYATKFTSYDPSVPSELVSIVDEDVQALMEVVHGAETKKLDLILHSPGGSPDAAEGIVNYLRSKFSHIRIIVPQLAQSAATMICCAADEVVMGAHSSLGPTDPQIYVNTSLGPKFVPTQAIIGQFEMAKTDCADKNKLPAWLPMLPQYGPHLVKTCSYLTDLSAELVEEWLYKYMLRRNVNRKERKEKAKGIAKWLSNHEEFKTHGRHISPKVLLKRGMNIKFLEDDQTLQDNTLAAFHATTHSFDMGPAVKIVENHCGKAFIKQVYKQFSPMPIQMPFPAGQFPTFSHPVPNPRHPVLPPT